MPDTANFRDKCRMVSDEQMQSVWSRVLSGEVNAPGSFSRRTVNLLNDLDKTDCELFTKLCCFCWSFGKSGKERRGSAFPYVVDYDLPIYQKRGIHFSALTHLESIGLINFYTPVVDYNRRVCFRRRPFTTSTPSFSWCSHPELAKSTSARLCSRKLDKN